ncbi:MAG: integral rane sensor signal transduction histidine kinase, partial [Deltaproteobacteria bacterium]|nr:integral rane sensor signal transduction histidine kinase [Deltaproteobacteria bacterium]
TVELAVQAIREGAHDFVAKPFTPALLLQVINREVDRRRLKREAQRVKDLEEELSGLTRVKAEMEKLATIESRFMLTMVHVLRAPVAVMQNSIQLIQKGYVSAEELPQLFSRLDLRAGELLAILDDLLLLSRLKEGLGTQPAEPVSVAEALETVCSSFQKEATERQLILSTEITARPFVLGNPDHLRLLGSQLLSNAIRYTPSGGRITLSLKTDPQEKRIQGTISDTGIGIAPDEIPRIFEEFYRTEAAKSMQETGTGLGLPIVQLLLSLYGGTIEIDSTPGKGSSFRFTLPEFTREAGARP